MKLLITIDTEEDDAWAGRPEVTTENVTYCVRFQQLCDRYAFPPSWLDGLLRAAGRGSIADRLLHDLVLDVSKARLRLGWSPPLGFEAGIAQTVGDYLDRRRSSP